GIDFIFEEGNPAGIKALLKIKGITELDVRLPLIEASISLQEKLRQFVNNIA
ncbi:MAG: 4-hydroxy-tetrahydrodipicolinate synthase, partial [Zetaproteobacteria bacterium]|nr:4-hydroxy-tetrahydrodipicolinate synthase [Flavobacteriales bacterium]